METKGYEHLHIDYGDISLLNGFATRGKSLLYVPEHIPDMEMTVRKDLIDRLLQKKTLRSIDDSWNGS